MLEGSGVDASTLSNLSDEEVMQLYQEALEQAVTEIEQDDTATTESVDDFSTTTP